MFGVVKILSRQNPIFVFACRDKFGVSTMNKNKSVNQNKNQNNQTVHEEPESRYLHEFREIKKLDEKYRDDETDNIKETVSSESSVKPANDKSSRNERKNTIPDYEFLFDSEAEAEQSSGSGIMKRLFRENIWKLFISSLLYIVKNSAAWVVPIVTANVINLASHPESKSQKLIIVNILILLVLIIQNVPTHVIYSKFTDRMLRTVGAGLRNTLIKKLQHLSITYHKEIETGRIQSKFLRDIEAIEFFNTHFVKSIIPAIIGIIISIGISVSKSPTVTLFFIIVIPINVSVIYAFRKKMAANNKKFRRETENMSAKVSNMLDMLPVTKAHGLEEEEIVSVEQKIKSLFEKGLNLDRTNAYFGSWAWVVAQCISTVCLLFTSYLAMKGKIPVGDIVLYQSYFNSISGNVQALISIYPELAKGVESLQSVSEIMLSNDIENNKNKIRLRYVHGTVDFSHVYYRYPHTDKDIIKDLNLHVEPGECIAFVGASGSGKSTVMNMIIGFLTATSGEITIDGKPIDALNLSDYRHFISVVPQNSILFTGTIRENILYGMENVSEEKFQKVLEQANINEFLDTLPDGINTLVGENGGRLSGGQKQRISIARALIRDPKILILDEATSALDNISEYQVQKAISRLIKERTTFIVAHRLSTIRDADRIVVMDNGSCVETGTYDELMAMHGRFCELKNLSDMNMKPDEA